MSEAHRYGRHYWCVKTPRSKSGEVYVHADEVQIVDGALVLIRKADDEKGRPALPNLAFAPGHWCAFFAASVLDGNPVAVEHWKGEIDEIDNGDG
jgi:hypothetical protein